MNLANLKKTVYYLKRNGLKNTLYAVGERLEERKAPAYTYEEPEEAELLRQRQGQGEDGPLFSVVVPLFRTPEKYLRELADSVLEQTYSKLELVLADATEDDSVEDIVRMLVTEEKEKYGCERIRYHRLEKNGGISENTNCALSFASGDYVGLLDHDDLLTKDALYEMYVKIREGSERGKAPLVLYSDEDKCSSDRSCYFEPHRKKEFDRELLLSNNYFCHFLVMKTELIRRLGLRKAFDGAQDFDLVLRAVYEAEAQAGADPWEERIVHVPKILYHWRCHQGSTAENPASKFYAYESGLKAVQDAVLRYGWRASVKHMKHLGFYRVEYEPDLFLVRKDVGIVGGSLTAGTRLCSGALDRDGKFLYPGLKKGYSGYMHRAVLRQEAYAVDIRCIAVNPECRELFAQVTGVPYLEKEGGAVSEKGAAACFDVSGLKGQDLTKLSLKLCEAFREAGYRIVWDPSFCRKEREV